MSDIGGSEQAAAAVPPPEPSLASDHLNLASHGNNSSLSVPSQISEPSIDDVSHYSRSIYKR